MRRPLDPQAGLLARGERRAELTAAENSNRAGPDRTGTPGTGLADRKLERVTAWPAGRAGADDSRVVEAAMIKLSYQLAGMLVSVLGGAIFDLFMAVIGRGAAEGTRKFTAVWPGGNRDPSSEGA